MSASPDFSLIFVNYRSARYLSQSLESLFSYEKEHVLFEVIVVNNDCAESEALLELKKSFPFLLIESGENLGFGQANNVGAKAARGALLSFINPDTLWMGDFLEKIKYIFTEKKEIGILGMALRDRNNQREAWSAGKFPSLLRLVWNNIFPARHAFWPKLGLSFPDWVSGGALHMRREIFSAVGGFDERFFLYFEDVDLCAEVRKRGHQVAIHTDLPIMHLGGKSNPSTRKQKTYFYASQQKYFEKRRPKWESNLLSLLRIF